MRASHVILSGPARVCPSNCPSANTILYRKYYTAIYYIYTTLVYGYTFDLQYTTTMYNIDDIYDLYYGFQSELINYDIMRLGYRVFYSRKKTQW